MNQQMTFHKGILHITLDATILLAEVAEKTESPNAIAGILRDCEGIGTSESRDLARQIHNEPGKTSYRLGI